MLRKLILLTVIVLLVFSQYLMIQWKVENQVLNGDEIRSWQIVLDRYGVSEKYRDNHIYSAEEILQENHLVRGYHQRSMITHVMQRLFVNIDSTHPNLYYAFLRLFFWRGIDGPKGFIGRAMLLNLLFYSILLLYLYRLHCLLFGPSLFRAILVLGIYSMMMGHLANLMLIRMYYLAAMSLIILCYYVLCSIKEQSFLVSSVPLSSRQFRCARILDMEALQFLVRKVKKWNTGPSFSILSRLFTSFYQFTSSKSIYYYRGTTYLYLLLVIYLNYSSHYFAILAVFVWGLILLLHYRKELKVILTYAEIFVVSIVLMSLSQLYFLYNLVTATRTKDIIKGSSESIFVKLSENMEQSFNAYVSMVDFYFIPWRLLLPLLVLSAILLAWRYYKKKGNINSKEKHLVRKCQLFLLIFLLILPIFALFLSPVGKTWRIIVPYTPLFALLFPLFLQSISKSWLRSILLLVVLGYYAWNYQSQVEKLHLQIYPVTNIDKIPFMYVVNRLRDHKKYFYSSVVRLLANNYLYEKTRYQYFETVADMNNLEKSGYILLGPYMQEELEYLEETKGLEVVREYPGGLYAYRLP